MAAIHGSAPGGFYSVSKPVKLSTTASLNNKHAGFEHIYYNVDEGKWCIKHQRKQLPSCGNLLTFILCLRPKIIPLDYFPPLLTRLIHPGSPAAFAPPLLCCTCPR